LEDHRTVALRNGEVLELVGDPHGHGENANRCKVDGLHRVIEDNCDFHVLPHPVD
jgi:hypothetical protein